MADIDENIAEASQGALAKAYEDLLSPAVKPIGEIASYIPRAIKIFLAPFEKWLINREETIRLTKAAITEKLNKIPEEKIVAPEAYVAIPAMQQLSYCQDSKALREMYANLLVSSMNSDKKDDVHPGFIDIIKQLTPDEAKLLNTLSPDTIFLYPLIDMSFRFTEEKGEHPLIKNFTTQGADILDNPRNMPSYIDNLARLGIIDISGKYERLSDEKAYEPLESSPLLETYKLRNMSGDPAALTYRYTRRYFHLTAFGSALIRICCTK